MNKLLVVWAIITICNSAHGAHECVFVQEKGFNEIRDELIMDGKPIHEVNDTMRARMSICRNMCEERGEGICIAKKK